MSVTYNPYSGHKVRITRKRRGSYGLVLVEIVLVFLIISLMLGIAVPYAIKVVRKTRLDADAARFARTLRKTAELAVLYGRELDVVVDITDGYYTIYDQSREEESNDETINDGYEYIEPVIEQQGLDHCYIEQIDFPDGSHQYSGELILHATAEGWGTSIVFNLIDDRNQRKRYVRCDRQTVRVKESRQPLSMLEPKKEVSMTMPM